MDIEKLKKALPGITADLVKTMIDDALGPYSAGVVTLEQVVPAVRIEYQFEGKALKVTLSISTAIDEEAAAETPMTVREAALDLLESIDETEAFIDLEGGQNGEGSVVRLCHALGVPVPQNLASWLAKYADEGDGDPGEG